MANYTPNYNLKKPLDSDFYNIADYNSNMDIIDAALYTKVVSDWNEAVTPGWYYDSGSAANRPSAITGPCLGFVIGHGQYNIKQIVYALYGNTGMTRTNSAPGWYGWTPMLPASLPAKGGNADTAAKLSTARTIAVSGAITGTATSFDGSGNITIPATAINLSYANAGVLPIARGGLGNTVGYIQTGKSTGTTPGTRATIEGIFNKATGTNSHAEGSSNTASAENAHAEGTSGIASGQNSHVEGSSSKAEGANSHAEGYYTEALGHQSHAEGGDTVAAQAWAHAGGQYTKANYCQYAIGRYNADTPGVMAAGETTGSFFVVGNGTSDTARSNAFRVSATGAVYGALAYNTGGADYAEYFEWEDGNPDNEDRRGRCVTLSGDKIALADANSQYILGIISANPSVVGNAYDDQWQGMYLIDVFGGLIHERKIIPAYTDENGIEHPETETMVAVLNPDYDPSRPYIPRSERPEWAVVGMLGKLIATDDGTCKENGYCRLTDGGIVTASAAGYRVLKRVDDSHVQIIFR